ncbi:MAG TPA: hypothetical protein DCS28_00710 [Candidatus Moranbacteria bacterium]|nr:hypothetical protein [Candidatus Moranbacteria bacterium]HAT74549.1 hypothetical protein [Candidatus Moranbacteria bacterium]
MKKIIVVGITLVIAIFGLTLVFLRIVGKNKIAKNNAININVPRKNQAIPASVFIPEKIISNKFGWLGGGTDDTGEGIIARGGLWVRTGPPGPFVWDIMQKSKDAGFNFAVADQIVNNFQKNNISILAIIFPFADWDQKNLVNSADCKVSDIDEFLIKNDKKGRGVYLPYYRCNPNDWAAYQEFVKAIVERYDGDGINDMHGLKIPIKYWEVMNEPDLQYKSNSPYGEFDRSTFYRQGPEEYARLLVETSKAIRLADSEAKILIAAPAGADERALSFYREVFKNADARNAFDIGNIHCIANDQNTHDFNVGPYKKMLADSSIADKPIWVTEADAMYGKIGEENYQSTKKSATGAIAAGAERIFFTGDIFDDQRTDLSQLDSGVNTYPSEEKFREIVKGFLK